MHKLAATLCNSYLPNTLPQVSKNTRYTKDLFMALVSIARDHILTEKYGTPDGEVVFFVSRSQLARVLGKKSTDLDRISGKLSNLTYHNLICKLDDDEIPTKMLAKSYDLMANHGFEKRVNFYKIPSWVIQHILTMEDQAKIWKRYGYTIKGSSYEMFYRAEGLEVAQRMYPQHKKIKVETIDTETGEVVTVVKDRTTTKKSDQRVMKISEIMARQIEKQGYTTELEVAGLMGGSTQYNLKNIQKMRGELVEHGFERVRANKDLNGKYNITEPGFPMLIVPTQYNPSLESSHTAALFCCADTEGSQQM